jgi:hypothetical protein
MEPLRDNTAPDLLKLSQCCREGLLVPLDPVLIKPALELVLLLELVRAGAQS